MLDDTCTFCLVSRHRIKAHCYLLSWSATGVVICIVDS
jgi:hypothetical protein